MNINSENNQVLPDEKELQKLVNQFFRQLPNETAQIQDPSLQQELPADFSQQNVIPFSSPVKSAYGADALNIVKAPSPLGGAGITPGALQGGKLFSMHNPETSLPDPNFTDKGVPISMSGMGASPSLMIPFRDTTAYSGYLENKEKPQTQTTALPDVKNIPLAEDLKFFPFGEQQGFEQLTKEAINAISTYLPSTELPLGAGNGLNEATFYFMSGKEYKPKDYTGFPSAQKNAPVKTHGLTALVHPPFDANLIKRDFPILQQRVNGKPLIWLDNAATTQKPRAVIDRLKYFYENENSNIHRAAHDLAARATDAYEAAREKVRQFLNAASANEIVFVRGTTEGINLVAKSWGEQNLKAGDEIILSHLEHHANIVPWQQLATKNGLKIRVIPVDDTGQIILDEYGKLLNPKTKLVALTQVSNALGTVTPVPQISAMAHAAGAKVLIDGAQSVSHMRTDVRAIDADWFVFSGHKIFAPTGIGVVYGKEALLNETQPWQGGGNMIADVTFEETKYQNAPARYEAGTGNIADAVGLGAAIDYVTRLGIENIMQYEHYLLLYATQLMQQVPGLTLIGTAHEKASVLSFVLEGYKTEQVGAYLNEHGIAVRSGHHCAQPILRRFGLEATVRPSLAFYNTCSDVDTLVSVLHKLAAGRK
jgi:cysteine desulfurase/selenocysteine lyase